MFARLRRFLVAVFSAAVFCTGVLCWYAYLHYTDPETIRELVLDKVQKFLPKARVSLDAADGQPFGGVRLSEFVLQHAAADGSTVEVLRLPAVYLTINRQQLLEGVLGLDRVVLDKPIFHFHRDENGRWNVADWITGQPIRVPSATEVVVRGGRIRLTGLGPSMEDLELDGVDCKIQLRPPAELTWQGLCRHVLAEEIRTSGSGDLWTRAFHGEVSGASPVAIEKILDAAPEALRARFQEIGDVVGLVEWKAHGDVHSEQGRFLWDGSVQASLQDVGFIHPKLPYPVTDASGELTVRKTGVELRGLKWSLGPARGSFDGAIRGFDVATIEGAGELRGLPFSEQVYRRLTPKHRLTWDRFSPRGATDLRGRIRQVQGRAVVDGSAHLKGAELCFNKFPYPIRQVQGRADLHPEGNVSIELEGRGGESPVVLSGRISDLVDAARIELELSGKGVALDETFERALAPDILAVYRKFQLQGKGDFVARIGRSRAGEPVDFSIEADVSCERGRCEWFPYDLERVTGRLSISPYRTDFRDFKGFSRGGVVEVEGRSIKTAAGSHLEVRLHGADLSLDEKLRTALAPEQREVWDSLRPEGRIDAWCIAKRTGDQEVDLRLTFDPAKTAITAAAFPYRLERFVGRVEYHQRRTWWKDLQARHGDAAFRCTGEVLAAPERVSIHLADLVSDQAPLTGDLRQAVPEGLQNVIDFLSPNRPVAVRFKTLDVGWVQGPAPQPTQYAFDGELAFRNTDLAPAIGARNATGRIVLIGRGTGDKERVIEGNLGLASINVAGFTATNASSRLEVRDHDLKLSNIRADIYDGQLIGSVKASCDAQPRYECVLDGYNARLGKYVREASKAAPTIDGLVDFRLFLHGAAADPGLQGGGRLVIREADIQGLPIVQDLFRLLSFQAPTGRAFDEVDCNFRFEGRRAIVQKLELLGPAEVMGPSLSLFNVGEGVVDLDTLRVNMTLAPRFARGRWKIPIFTDVMNAASDNLVEIPVGGTLSDPVPLVDTLPGLRRAFEMPARLLPARGLR